MYKKIKVDFSSKKSIAEAEKKKTELEDKGYFESDTRQVGIDTFIINMKKKVR